MVVGVTVVIASNVIGAATVANEATVLGSLGVAPSAVTLKYHVPPTLGILAEATRIPVPTVATVVHIALSGLLSTIQRWRN